MFLARLSLEEVWSSLVKLLKSQPVPELLVKAQVWYIPLDVHALCFPGKPPLLSLACSSPPSPPQQQAEKGFMGSPSVTQTPPDPPASLEKHSCAKGKHMPRSACAQSSTDLSYR